MGVEYEIKFRATPELLDQIQAGTPGQEVRYEMRTTYYDTPSRALSARRYTLRQRMENGRSVCTLKCPASEGGRGEFETECGHLTEALPILCKLSDLPDLPSLLTEGIEPVCGAAFTRIAKTLLWDGSTLELALDRGVLTGGGREVPLFEAEVELKAGSREAVQAYASLLALRYGLSPEPHSKFRRALALAQEV